MAYLNKRLEAQVLLSQDITQSRVAELLKISRKTIGRWLKEPDFKEGIVSGRKAQLEAALARNTLPINDASEEFKAPDNLSLSQKLIAKSFATLDEILTNPEVKTTDRLKAAQLVLSQCGGGNVSNFGVKQIEQSSQNNIDTLLARRENLRARIKTLESRRALEGSTEAKVSKSI